MKLKNWNINCVICGEHFTENERCICPCHDKEIAALLEDYLTPNLYIKFDLASN